MAMGILGIGLVLVAMVFPAGIKLTGVATERTIGAIAANEAVAKIQLFGLRDFQYWPAAVIAEDKNVPVYRPPANEWENATYDSCDGFLDTAEWMHVAGNDGLFGTTDDLFTNLTSVWDEFLYPSTSILPVGQERNTHWSALCRRVGEKDVQVTVFVTRKNAAGMSYYSWDYVPAMKNFVQGTSFWPSPVPVYLEYEYDSADPASRKKLLVLPDQGNEVWELVSGQTRTVFGFFDDAITIVEDRTGKIYQVLEYKDANGDQSKDTLVLMKEWQWPGYEMDPFNPPVGKLTRKFWVVPPAVGSDRNPVIAVTQTTVTIK